MHSFVHFDLQVLSGASSGAGATSTTSAGVQSDDGEGKYSLIGIISHLGKNTDHGHYVCHLKKDGQWLLFNDEKVEYILCQFTVV